MNKTYSKHRYYIYFLYYKIRIIIDSSKGRNRLLLAELIHIWNVLFRKNLEMPGNTSIQTITTIFGTYKFIGDNYGYSIISPAFERPDKMLFIDMIKQMLKRDRKVLYLDVGAFVGDYTVGILKFIKKNSVVTLAFEPDPVNYQLLNENIHLNQVEGVRTYNIGLGNKNDAVNFKGYRISSNGIVPKTVPYRLKTLDSILPVSYYRKFDDIFIKVDIEGHEEEVFEGAHNLLKSGVRVHLMIEDCVNPSIILYLQKHGFRFVTKITPYDSFWEIT